MEFSEWHCRYAELVVSRLLEDFARFNGRQINRVGLIVRPLLARATSARFPEVNFVPDRDSDLHVISLVIYGV